MAGNTFGEIFRVTTFGESHGVAIGLVIDGCPSNVKLDLPFIQKQLDRRRPGQSVITTQRNETDAFEIISGVFEGKTTGTPLSFLIYNKDVKSEDYDHLKTTYRPSHADFTYQSKYGVRDYRGGGRSSARETAARVIAGAVAQQILSSKKIHCHAFVSQVGEIKLTKNYSEINPEKIYSNMVRCPDDSTAKKMISLIEKIKSEGDTIGGVITGVINGVPAGLGEPVFDKLHADLAKAMMSINAVHGFEYGEGFNSVTMRGSQHNDLFEKKGNKIITKTNHSGGIQGGISNGQPVYFRVAFKPVATLMIDQQSVTKDGKKSIIKGKGRHDPCVVPRAVPIVESMAALVILDHYMRNRSVTI